MEGSGLDSGEAMKNTKILIVDDEPMSVKILSHLLETEYTTLMAHDGREALEILSRVTPDLIILDVVMPEMDGYEVFRALRKIPGLEDVPVLFISVMNETECEHQGLEMGAGDYIIKPFNPSLVRLRVKNHLAFHQERKLLAQRTVELEQLNELLAAEVTQRRAIQADNEQLIRELREAVENVNTLTELIPICASCKKVRDDKGYWNQIETYLSKHTDLTFSHGLCLECATRLYPGSTFGGAKKTT